MLPRDSLLYPKPTSFRFPPSLILRAKIGRKKTQNQKQKPRKRSWSTITTNPTTLKRKKETKRAKLLPLPFLPFPVHLPKLLFFTFGASLSLCIFYFSDSDFCFPCHHYMHVSLSLSRVWRHLSFFLSFFTQKRETIKLLKAGGVITTASNGHGTWGIPFTAFIFTFLNSNVRIITYWCKITEIPSIICALIMSMNDCT